MKTQIEPKIIDLPLDQLLNFTKFLIFQQLSNHQKPNTIKLVDNFQKDIKNRVDKFRKTVCC